MSDCEWISRAEVARRLFISPQAVTKYCKRGLAWAAGRTQDRRLFWPSVERWVARNISLFECGNPDAIRKEHWLVVIALRGKAARQRQIAARVRAAVKGGRGY
jgi:hypothetical protein